MRRRTNYALIFILVLALTAGVVGAGWGFTNPYVTMSGLNQLTATVTINPDNTYHYVYSLVFSTNSGQLKQFSIGNLKNLPYTNRACSEAALPIGSSSNSVLWASPTTITTAKTVVFSYDSIYSYGEVNVTINTGGMPSTIKTLGMVPEPSSLLAVAFGVSGVLWTRLRRRR